MATTSRQNNQCGSTGDNDFLARMQAQCEEIEAYRMSVKRRENRSLSMDQAAREWIDRYAHTFMGVDD